MARSPVGVSMGVSGDAQTGQLPFSHVHTPPWHTIERLQSGPQSTLLALHGVPACGIVAGQPLGGDAQAHSGGLMVSQIGYSLPPWQSLHQQRVPLPYQQESVLSLHVLPDAGGGEGQAGGSGAVAQPVASGCVTDHVSLAVQSALVRHDGRGSLPQLHCATGPKKRPVEASAAGGGVQWEPSAGGAAGQENPADPPLPPVPLPDILPLHPAAASTSTAAPTHEPRMRGTLAPPQAERHAGG